MNFIRDRALLLFCGLGAALFAWGYFYLLQDQALIVFLLMTNLGLWIENRALRKRMESTACLQHPSTGD